MEETSATLDQLNDAKDVQRCACVRTVNIAAKVQKQHILPQSTGTLGLRFPRDISFLRKKQQRSRVPWENHQSQIFSGLVLSDVF